MNHSFSQDPDLENQAFLCRSLVETLGRIEIFQRRYHPPMLPGLLNDMRPTAGRLARALSEALDGNDESDDSADLLTAAGRLLFEGLELLYEAGRSDAQGSVFRVMRAMRKWCRAQETLFPLCRRLPSIHRYFLDADARAGIEAERPPPGGEDQETVIHVGCDADPYARGAFSIYVPPGAVDAPRGVVVALHGGQGHGRDFLWTWLREARSRDFIVVAPTSTGPTWHLLAPDEDFRLIGTAIDYADDHWSIDPSRILLTGISDGATFSLIGCQQEGDRFSAFAPVAGVLVPVDLAKTRGKRVLWIHGALDWMFPVGRAQSGRQLLQSVGCDIVLRVIDDLSHAYPREANSDILDWFGISKKAMNP